MKRMIVTAAMILAASTPAFTQNPEQENNAAIAAVTYMIRAEALQPDHRRRRQASRNDHLRDREPWLQRGKSGLR